MKPDRFEKGDIVMASMVYNKTIRLLGDAVRDSHGVELDIGGGSPSARFEQVVEELKRLLTGEADRRALAAKLDLEPGTVQGMSEQLLASEADNGTVDDIDDLAPRTIKTAFYDIAYRRGISGATIDVPLVDFLRDALSAVFVSEKLRGRVNIGANRHFPRLLQYVRECEEETHWSDRERGFWLKNAGGRGKVAQWPAHPSLLKLTITLDLL